MDCASTDMAIINIFNQLLYLQKIENQARLLLGGGHGITVGHVIHEAGAAAILTRRHAEPLVALLAHKRSEQFSQVKICCL